MSNVITSPFTVFFDRSGQPLDNGYVYIGTAGINPEVSPITVYWDTSLTTTAAQPIRTLAGYPSRSGSPGTITIKEAYYSIVIKDKNGSLVYSDLNVSTSTPESYRSFINDFGGIPDNTTDNGVAFDTAAAVGNAIVWLDFPAGTDGRYYTTRSFAQITANNTQYVGPGAIRLSDGSTFPGNTTRQSSMTRFEGANTTDFSGIYRDMDTKYTRLDATRTNGFSTKYYDKSFIPDYHYVDFFTTGSSGTLAFLDTSIIAGATSAILNSVDGLTVGQTIGFRVNFVETSAFDRRAIATINTGTKTITWVGGLANAYSATSNATTIYDSPRTNSTPFMIDMTARSWGDSIGMTIRGTGAPLTPFLAGQTKTDQRATMGVFSGDLTAGVAGINLTAEEYHLNSAGYAVGMLGYTLSIDRSSAYGGYNEYVLAAYNQSGGTYYADAGIVMAGKWDCGFTTHIQDASNNSQCAYAMAKGHRIYYAATGGATLGKVTPGNSYTEKTVSDNAIRVVNAGLDCEVATETGDVINPNKAGVIARLSASTTNDKTGDGTVYTLVCDTETADQGLRYNSSNGVFTATVVGLYLVSGQVVLTNVDVSHTAGRILLQTSIGADYIFYSNPSDTLTGDGVAPMTFSAIVKLALAETLSVGVYVAGSTKTIGIVGGAALETFISIVQVA